VRYLFAEGRVRYLFAEGRVRYLFAKGRVHYLFAEGRVCYLFAEGRVRHGAFFRWLFTCVFVLRALSGPACAMLQPKL
jgi:hypothetical protein